MTHTLRATRLVVVLGVAIATLGTVGCSTKPRGPVTVPLTFRPTDQLNLGAAEGIMTKSASVVVEDRRDRKDQIGENTEKDVPVPVFAGPPEPAEFVREALTRNLSASGVAVSQPGGTAERTILVGLTRFWVDEGSTYKANVAATVRVLPAGGGQALWEGQATGANTRFGRSLSTENYQESLSDATMQLCNKLLSDPGFRAAFK